MPRVANAAKPKGTASVEVLEAVDETPAARTNWKVFTSLKLVPVKITCQEYAPIHWHNISCHSNLPIDADTMKAHLDAGHGGSYFVTLEPREKAWPGWNRLSELGVELADLRCNVCLKELPVAPNSILKHMKSHLSANRRVQKGGTFRMTLSMSVDDVSHEEDIDE